MSKKTKLMLGDNITNLKKLPDNSIDSIVTDPPYGLSFMNKKWDHNVPSVDFWKEVYRVLKPGGHVLSFGGTRTYHRMVVNIEDAGFEIRDQIQWLYGSGFPKSHNIGKAVDKITKGTSPYEGWGTALKPANEPICVARKPISEKTVAKNVLKWGTGGINIDGCRIGSEGGTARSGQSDKVTETGKDTGSKPSGSLYRTGHEVVELNEGRFPANIILDEIAAEYLDEQSGVSKSTKFVAKNTGYGKSNTYINYKDGGSLTDVDGGYNDKGGASRFFYQAKVSKKERNMGLDGFEDKENKITNQSKKCENCNKWELSGNGEGRISGNPEKQTQPKKNFHPTVKPVKLMAYLCRLVTPVNGIVLDPFMGSGSTGIAARLEGFRFCGMEMDEDYFKIAESRIDNFEDYKQFIKKK